MPRINEPELSVCLRLEMSHLETLRLISKVGGSNVGNQIRRAVKEYLERRTKEIEQSKVVRLAEWRALKGRK